MADDLDDEWWLDEGTSSKDVPEDDEENSSEDEQQSESVHPKATKERKRKHEKAGPVEEVPAKKKKKKKKISEVISKQKSKPLVPEDLIKAISQTYDGKLSTIEWDEILLDADEHFCPCNASPDDSDPSSYLQSLLPSWKKLLKKEGGPHGSPLLLIITASGIRSASLNREILNFKTEKCQVAKLFAKHMKLDEQMKFLMSKPVHIGIGTPNRIATLLENDALSLDQLKFIVLDWSFRDMKLRRMVDIPEVKKDLFPLLTKYLIPFVKSNDSGAKFGLL